MSVLLSTLMTVAAASTSAPASCNWDHPGRDPFMNDLAQAVDVYKDIPEPIRDKLKQRLEHHAFDDLVVITRDAIEGQESYAPDITSMQFGSGKVCASVSRASWDSSMQESGLVYCEQGYCLLVPSVCRNLSRISRLTPGPGQPTPETPGELVFEPPGAIMPPGDELQPPFPGAPDTFFGEQPPVSAPPATSPPGWSWPTGPFWLSSAPLPTGLLPPVLALPAAPLLPPPVSAVPEPSCSVLLGVGLAVLTLARSLRRRGRPHSKRAFRLSP